VVFAFTFVTVAAFSQYFRHWESISICHRKKYFCYQCIALQHDLNTVGVMIFIYAFLKQGAIVGQIVGTFFQGWVAVSSFVYGRPPEKHGFLPTSTGLCVEASSLNSTQTFITQDVFTTLATTEAVGTNSTRWAANKKLLARPCQFQLNLSILHM